MDDRENRERRMTAEQVRIAALAIAAVARIGTNATPAELMSVAGPLIPWITRPPAMMLLAITTTEGEEMPLTVDSVNAVAVLSFEDDHGDPVAPPAGALATATSDNPAVMTVGAAVGGADVDGIPNIQFPLAEVTQGTATLSVAATDASGNPLLGPDGVTPIPAPAPVLVTVTPGAAAAEVFAVPGN